MTIFFISDTHFGHANFLKFLDNQSHTIRVFDSVEHMDETMVSNWNSVVRPSDKVYHLGDVTFDIRNFRRIASRLNGHKRLIVGNHDDPKNVELTRWFEKVNMWRVFKDCDFVCTHVPIPRTQLPHGVHFNLHGHIHQNVMSDPWYVNLCVEKINYTPVSMEEVGDFMYRARYENGDNYP